MLVGCKLSPSDKHKVPLHTYMDTHKEYKSQLQANDGGDEQH